MTATWRRTFVVLLLLAIAGCESKEGIPDGLQILNPPLVAANAYVEQGEFTFQVIVKNVSQQLIEANTVKMKLTVKELAAGACSSNYASEDIQIPAVQPNHTWTAAKSEL